MKLFFFILVVIAIYILASCVNVSHIDSLPKDHQDQLKKRSTMRSTLLNNYINESVINSLSDKYSSEQFQSTDYKRNFQDLTGGVPELPNASNLLYLIKSEFLDDQYKFNIANLPTTTHTTSNHKYEKYIRKNIDGWNEIFYKYFQSSHKYLKVRGIKIVFLMETETEFIITVNVSLIYQNRTIHFQLSYYGQRFRSDDIINMPEDNYNFQLVRIKPIARDDFESNPVDNLSNFISMDDQLKYVRQINNMHKNENN